MRVLRRLLRDRGTLLPLIVLLVQLLTLQASVGAYASGRMAVVAIDDAWCIGMSVPQPDRPNPAPDWHCASLCATVVGVGKALLPQSDAAVDVTAVEASHGYGPVRRASAGPRAPPPRAGPSRAPPTAA